MDDIGGKAGGGEEEKNGAGDGGQDLFHGASLLRNREARSWKVKA